MKKISLNVSGPWEFREFPETARHMNDLDDGRWLKTDHPRSIFLSLAQAKILTVEDLYAHPAVYNWVGRQAWVFRTRFNMPQEHLPAHRKELVFEGLDTITQIWLNNKLLGRTDNMFMTHRFDVGSLIRLGENSLVIQFLPAHEHATKKLKQYGKINNSTDIPPAACLRKAQYQFGSDMGPSLVNCGISGPVCLELTHIAEITNIHLRTIDCNESFADILAAITISPTQQARMKDLRCLLRFQTERSMFSHILDFRDQRDQLSTVLRIQRPILWQPKGYGSPLCYHVLVQLYSQDTLLDEKKILFGIRTVRILRPPQEESAPLTLEINQQPIQTKGVYWIPLGLLPAWDEQEKKALLLHKLAEANINTLCIWGGGGYEDDSFYELCDKLGILVWQELTIPPLHGSDSHLLIDGFRSEVEQAARRLRNHPCLIGWSNGPFDGYPIKLSDKRKKQIGNESLYKELIKLLNEWDPDRECAFACSATVGPKNPNRRIYTALWLNSQQTLPPLDEHPPQALPCLKTLQMICRDEEIYPGSAPIENQIYPPRPHSDFRWTETLFAPPKNTEEQLYQSQVAQARWAKKRIESIRPQCNLQQQIMPWTAGQFWPCAGYSMVDFAQRPNAIYYYTKRGFAPVMACLLKKNEIHQTFSTPSASVAAVVVNDRPESLAGKIVFELLDMKGQRLDTAEFPVFIGPHARSSDIIPPRAFLEPLFPEKTILRLAVIVNEQTAYENIYLYLPDKYAAFKHMEIDMAVRPVSERKILLNLKSRYFVKDLEIVPPQNAQLQDNFFDLLPGRNYEVAASFTEPILRPDAPWRLRSVCVM